MSDNIIAHGNLKMGSFPVNDLIPVQMVSHLARNLHTRSVKLIMDNDTKIFDDCVIELLNGDEIDLAIDKHVFPNQLSVWFQFVSSREDKVARYVLPRNTTELGNKILKEYSNEG